MVGGGGGLPQELHANPGAPPPKSSIQHLNQLQGLQLMETRIQEQQRKDLDAPGDFNLPKKKLVKILSVLELFESIALNQVGGTFRNLLRTKTE